MNAIPLAHLLWILPLALLVAYVGSPRFLGTTARSRVRRLLRAALERQRYTVLDDLTLPAGGGTFHVDVLVVSRSGIFVINAIHKRGRLTGTRVQPLWVEKRFGRSRRFDNPVHVNFLRIQALERLLGLPLSRFHGLVAVSGQDRLDAGLPPEVVPVRQLVTRVRSENRPLLEPAEADRALLNLRRSALRPSWRDSGRGWKWLRAALSIVLVAGAYAAYRPELHRLAASVQRQADMRMAPENFHPDGRPKTERELWEDRLVCAHSEDTGRCACYEPRGARAEIADGRCRELAARGSILEQ
jgi:hypothetical protein